MTKKITMSKSASFLQKYWFARGFSDKLIHSSKDVPSIEMVEYLEEISGINVGVSHSERLPEEPFHRCPDITLAEKVINWSPQKNLDEIITKILED